MHECSIHFFYEYWKGRERLSIGLILGSSRINSNSKIPAEALTENMEHGTMDSSELSLTDVEDFRHEAAPAPLDGRNSMAAELAAGGGLS